MDRAALLISLACGLLVGVPLFLSGCGGESGPGPLQPGDKTRPPPVAPAVPPPTSAPTPPPCTSPDHNPFACHEHYVNPANSKEYDGSIKTASGKTKENLLRMQKVPSAYWIDVKEKIHGQGTRTVEGILQDASSRTPPELVVFIWYDLPNRDCDAKASLGQICCTNGTDGHCDYDTISDCADGLRVYKSGYVDPFVQVLQKYHETVPIVIVLEPDGLANLATNLAHPHCGNQATQTAYKHGAKYAVEQITSKAPKVTLYLDAGHGGWLGWENNMELFMKMLKGLDLPWKSIRGFATNTANYQPLGMQCPWCPDTGYRNGYCLMNHHKGDPCCSDPCGLAEQFNSGNNELNYASFLAAAATKRLDFHPHILIDTGRNGVPDMRQSCQNWCNPRNSGAGIPSTTETSNKSLVDAYFWLKTPGESDGCSATLASGKPCPRYDAMCGSIDALGTQAGEDPAPEAGGWYDFQVKQLAANAQFDASRHHAVPEFRKNLKGAICPFELKPGQKASDYNYTSATGQHPCSGKFQQCGGKGWYGPSCCAGECGCVAQGDYNSQCQPPAGKNDCGNATGKLVMYSDGPPVTRGAAERQQQRWLVPGVLVSTALLVSLGTTGMRWLRPSRRLSRRGSTSDPEGRCLYKGVSNA